MTNLEIVNKREAFTAKENVNGRDIFYHYETDNNTPTPIAVNFSTQGEGGKILSGSYSQGGGIALNGQGITDPSDLQIVEKVFETILKIVKQKTEEIQEPQAD